MNVEPFSLPLAHSLSTAAGDVESREGFLVRVEGEGVGEATPLPGWTESLSDCHAALESLDTADPDAVPDDRPAARHGVELAVADARAREAGVPLSRHFGGERRERVPVNATVGDAPADETAERVRAAADEGFPAVKVKVGVRSVAEDVARLRAAREAADVELRVDANGAWSREEAREALDALAGLVSYVEQPLAADDWAGLRDLPRPVDVALDESVPPDPGRALDCADVIVVKPMALGGPVRAREVALRAREAGVDPVVTTTIDGAIARAGAVHVAASLPEVRPCGLATGDLLARDLAADVAPVSAGYAEVPQKEGNIPLPSTGDCA